MSSGKNPVDTPGEMPAAGDLEGPDGGAHRAFVFRHIDFIIDTLAAETLASQWALPAGCPRATPATLGRRREKTEQGYRCCFGGVDMDSNDSGGSCPCGDPLCASDDPLDAVAATAIAPPREAASERYFDFEWRQTIADFRKDRQWETIADWNTDTVHRELSTAISRPAIARKRSERLVKLLATLRRENWNEKLTLRNLPAVPYESLHALLSSLPGISRDEGWWLVLTALDKPVWPADPYIDPLARDLRILPASSCGPRHSELEERLVDRQIAPLHRLLAANGYYGRTAFDGADAEVRGFSRQARATSAREDPAAPVAVDLFSGAGGLSCGFQRAGYRIALAADHDEYAADTYRLNHPTVPHDRVLCEDIATLACRDRLLDALADTTDIIIGGPPCQALSRAGYRARLANDSEYSVLDDPRTNLYREYVTIVDRIRPACILMENVTGLVSEVADTGVRIIDDVLDALDDTGYNCAYRILDASDFGLPQERSRVFIIGIDRDSPPAVSPDEVFETLLNRQTPPATLRQALCGLPRLRRGEGGTVVPRQRAGRPSDYVSSQELSDGTDLTYNHRAREHPMERDRELFDEVMEPGDTSATVKFEKGRGDLIDYDIGTEDDPSFKDKYRMLQWDEPAPTVVAHLAKDANNFIIPDFYRYAIGDMDRADSRRNRGVTPREAARLQSFPDRYKFLGPFTSQFRQIGNAVPPLLAERIAQVLREKVLFQQNRDNK